MSQDTQKTPALDLQGVLQNAPLQTGVMVSMITLVTQVFARPEVHSVFHLDSAWIAILVAALVAVYQVRFTQKCAIGQCLVLVPLSTLILFGLALSGNNSVANMIEKSPPAADAAIPDTQLIDNLKQQIDMQKQLIEELQKTLAQGTPHASSKDSEPIAWLDHWLGAVVGSAQAQDLPPDERKNLLDKLKEYQAKIKQLEVQQKILEQNHSLAKRDKNLEGTAQPQAQKQLWKTWGGEQQQ